jgi:hypothetical protein
MKSAIVLLLMTLAAGHAWGEIYRSVDQNGNVTFSDQPSSGAEKVQLPPIPTYEPPPLPVIAPEPQKKQQVYYEDFTIAQPANDATLRDNQGIVEVHASLLPRLRTDLGHKVLFYIDDSPRSQPLDSSSIRFTNVDRGTHTLHASVVDAQGMELISTPTVTFYLHRQSVNFPTRQAPPVVPR